MPTRYGGGRLSPLWRDRLATVLRGGGWTRPVLLRRLVAGALVVLAAALALLPTGHGTRVPVLVAARDLPPGTPLAPGDVLLRHFPPDAVPDGARAAVSDVAGRLLAGPARRGEPLTDVRLTGPELAALATGDPTAATVPVRLSDPELAALLHPGAVVDVVTVGERQDQPVVLAAGATVLAVPPAGDTATEGRLILVAMPEEVATRVAGASISQTVTVTFRQRIPASGNSPATR